MTDTDLLPDLLTDQYRVVGQLGSGGAGTVYLAQELGLDRKVAIKVLHGFRYVDETAKQRLTAEARALSVLEHPNIVRVFKFGFDDRESPYLVMEYISGSSLRNLLDRKGQFSLEEVLSIVMPLAQGLRHAHAQGIVHRDIKPENIIFSEAEPHLVKLIDFGLSRLKVEEHARNKPSELASNRLTVTGDMIGTPLYMSPEQCMGLQATMASDVYAFGCVLYEMITGLPPFIANDLPAILNLHIEGERPHLPAAITTDAAMNLLDEIIRRCLHRKPEQRYQNFSEIISAMEDVRALANKAKNSSHDSDTRQVIVPSMPKWTFIFAIFLFVFGGALIVWNTQTQHGAREQQSFAQLLRPADQLLQSRNLEAALQVLSKIDERALNTRDKAILKLKQLTCAAELSDRPSVIRYATQLIATPDATAADLHFAYWRISESSFMTAQATGKREDWETAANWSDKWQEFLQKHHSKAGRALEAKGFYMASLCNAGQRDRAKALLSPEILESALSQPLDNNHQAAAAFLIGSTALKLSEGKKDNDQRQAALKLLRRVSAYQGPYWLLWSRQATQLLKPQH